MSNANASVDCLYYSYIKTNTTRAKTKRNITDEKIIAGAHKRKYKMPARRIVYLDPVKH